MIQMIHKDTETPDPVVLSDYDTGDSISQLIWKPYAVNGTDVCSVCELTGLEEGVYSFSYGDSESNPVRILSGEGLDGTVLLQYARNGNGERTDMLSRFFGTLRYFELRLQGGFKDSGWSFKVDNEQFSTPMADIVELSSIDYTDRILTIGTSAGVPVWIPALVNRILSCPLVFIDGKRYSRSADSCPEPSDMPDETDDYVYSVLLREAHYLNPEIERRIRLTLRRTPQTLRGTRGQFRKIR